MKTELTVKADLYMLMAMSTMAAGKMIRLTGLEFTAIWMVRVTLVSGRKTNSMVKVWRPGLMVPATKVCILKGKNTEKDALHGQTAAHSQGTSWKTTSKVKVSNLNSIKLNLC